jgi:hypothetical protein
MARSLAVWLSRSMRQGPERLKEAGTGSVVEGASVRGLHGLAGEASAQENEAAAGTGIGIRAIYTTRKVEVGGAKAEEEDAADAAPRREADREEDGVLASCLSFYPTCLNNGQQARRDDKGKEVGRTARPQQENSSLINSSPHSLAWLCKARD